MFGQQQTNFAGTGGLGNSTQPTATVVAMPLFNGNARETFATFLGGSDKMLSNEIKEQLNSGQLKVIDDIVFATQTVGNSETIKFFQTQDQKELGLRNVSNAKLEKGQAHLVTHIRLSAAYLSKNDTVRADDPEHIKVARWVPIDYVFGDVVTLQKDGSGNAALQFEGDAIAASGINNSAFNPESDELLCALVNGVLTVRVNKSTMLNELPLSAFASTFQGAQAEPGTLKLNSPFMINPQLPIEGVIDLAAPIEGIDGDELDIAIKIEFIGLGTVAA